MVTGGFGSRRLCCETIPTKRISLTNKSVLRRMEKSQTLIELGNVHVDMEKETVLFRNWILEEI